MFLYSLISYHLRPSFTLLIQSYLWLDDDKKIKMNLKDKGMFSLRKGFLFSFHVFKCIGNGKNDKRLISPFPGKIIGKKIVKTKRHLCNYLLKNTK